MPFSRSPPTYKSISSTDLDYSICLLFKKFWILKKKIFTCKFSKVFGLYLWKIKKKLKTTTTKKFNLKKQSILPFEIKEDPFRRVFNSVGKIFVLFKSVKLLILKLKKYSRYLA